MRSSFSFMISLIRLICDTICVINHLIKSLPPRPVINNSTPTQTPQPFPRTVQTSALPNVTEPTQRVQLQSGIRSKLPFLENQNAELITVPTGTVWFYFSHNSYAIIWLALEWQHSESKTLVCKHFFCIEWKAVFMTVWKITGNIWYLNRVQRNAIQPRATCPAVQKVSPAEKIVIVPIYNQREDRGNLKCPSTRHRSHVNPLYLGSPRKRSP